MRSIPLGFAGLDHAQGSAHAPRSLASRLGLEPPGSVAIRSSLVTGPGGLAGCRRGSGRCRCHRNRPELYGSKTCPEGQEYVLFTIRHTGGMASARFATRIEPRRAIATRDPARRSPFRSVSRPDQGSSSTGGSSSGVTTPPIGVHVPPSYRICAGSLQRPANPPVALSPKAPIPALLQGHAS